MSELSHISLKTMQMMFQSIKAGQGSGMSLTRLEEILDIIRSQSVYTLLVNACANIQFTTWYIL